MDTILQTEGKNEEKLIQPQNYNLKITQGENMDFHGLIPIGRRKKEKEIAKNGNVTLKVCYLSHFIENTEWIDRYTVRKNREGPPEPVLIYTQHTKRKLNKSPIWKIQWKLDFVKRHPIPKAEPRCPAWPKQRRPRTPWRRRPP